MSPATLAMILWAPFMLVVFFAGLVYCVSGYRHGFWRALASLAAVILSTLLSVLASRLLAGLIAPSLAANVTMKDSGALTGQMLQTVLTGGIGAVIALLLFGLLLLIFTPIIGGIFKKLLRGKLPEPGKSMRLLGMTVGLVSAVMFTLFWLAPLYGSLATVMPVAQTVMQLQQTEQEDAAEVNAYVESLSEHLLVKASGTGPVRAVYDGLSSVPVGGASISVVEMSQAVNEAMQLVQQLQDAKDPDAFTQAADQLLEIVRETFLDQDWFYSLFQELMDQVLVMAEVPDTEDAAYVDGLLALGDMSKEEFQEVFGAVLDLTKYALDHELLVVAEDGDLATIHNTGIFQEMGRVFNSTPQLVEVKKLVLGMMLGETGLTFDQAMALMEKYQVGQITDPQQQLLEVEAILLPSTGMIPPAVTILRHPCLGEAALEEVMETVSFNALMGMGDYDEELASEEEQEELLAALRKVAKLPIEEIAQLDIGFNPTMDQAVVSRDMVSN